MSDIIEVINWLWNFLSFLQYISLRGKLRNSHQNFNSNISLDLFFCKFYNWFIIFLRAVLFTRFSVFEWVFDEYFNNFLCEKKFEKIFLCGCFFDNWMEFLRNFYVHSTALICVSLCFSSMFSIYGIIELCSSVFSSKSSNLFSMSLSLSDSSCIFR